MWAWLLKNPWRAVFLLAALGFGAMSLYSMALRKDYIVLQAERKADTATFGEQRAKLQSEIERQGLIITSYKEKERLFAENARLNAERLEQAQSQSAEARQRFEEAQRQREKSNQGWWNVFEGRSDTCKAATEALDIACKEVGRL